MTDNLSYDEQCLLTLIRSALNGHHGAAFPTPPDWETVVSSAKKHAVLPLLYDVLADRDDLPEGLKNAAVSESRKTVLQSYRLLLLSRTVVELLEEIRLPALVLKGVSVSGLYPVPELRKSGDVDILLLAPERVGDACRRLEEAGFSVLPGQHSAHHVGMRSPDHIEVELHTMLAEPFEEKRLNRYIGGIAARCAGSVRTEEVMGVRLPVLGDAYQAYSLLLHMLHHFLRSGFGLKLLCDWTVFWNHTYSKESEALYVKLIKESGIKGFSDIVTGTCVCFLGLKYENVRFMLEDGGDGRQRMEDAGTFLREVLDAGEFGGSGKERMVALRGTGPLDYLRAFHHQTRLNFPAASRVFLLLPVLWTVTLLRFLRNNRRLRGVSARSVLKSARTRGRLIKKLKLFEQV